MRRLKCRIDSKEKKLGLGTYPYVSLAAARAKRDEARTLIAAIKDPAIQKAREKAERKLSSENAFAAVAEEYIAERQKEGWAESTNTKSEWFPSEHIPTKAARVREEWVGIVAEAEEAVRGG